MNRYLMIVLMFASSLALVAQQRMVDHLASVNFDFGMVDYLGRLPVGERLQLRTFPMPDGSERLVSLKAFDVFADDAYISVRGDNGVEIARKPVPESRYFSGSIVGEENSAVFLRVNPDGMVKAVVEMESGLFFMGSMQNTPEVLVVEKAEDIAMLKAGRNYTCDALPMPGMKQAPSSDLHIERAISANGYTGTVAIDTDYELYQKFGNSESAMVAYIGDLFGVVNTIYNRDVDVQLNLGLIITYTSSNDPWKANDTSGALREFERVWKRDYDAVERTVAHQLSGRSLGGGIAYVGAICNNEYGYGVSQLDGFYDIPTFETWDIVVVSHELGHNFGSPHTHDYNPPIDTCTSGNLPPGGGTIMSYCHLLAGGMSNVNLEFHPRVQDQISATIQSSGQCLDGWGGGSGNTVTDTINDNVAGNQSNFYSIDVSGGIIDLSLTWSGGGDLDLYLYAPGGALVASSATLNKPEEITFSAGSAGTYTIEVLNYRAKAKDFTLTATYEP